MATNANHPYQILIIGGPGSGKANSLFNLINHQTDIDKVYLYAKDPYAAKYQFLINKRESKALEHFNDSKAFIKYSNGMDDICKNIEEYNPNKKQIINQKLQQIAFNYSSDIDLLKIL